MLIRVDVSLHCSTFTANSIEHLLTRTMKTKATLLSALLLIVNFYNLNAQAVDPHRGFQVGHFASFTPESINAGYGQLNLNFSILGNTQREDSLLQYACDNHITSLGLYDLYEVFKYTDSPGTSVGGK